MARLFPFVDNLASRKTFNFFPRQSNTLAQVRIFRIHKEPFIKTIQFFEKRSRYHQKRALDKFTFKRKTFIDISHRMQEISFFTNRKCADGERDIAAKQVQHGKFLAINLLHISVGIDNQRCQCTNFRIIVQIFHQPFQYRFLKKNVGVQNNMISAVEKRKNGIVPPPKAVIFA